MRYISYLLIFFFNTPFGFGQVDSILSEDTSDYIFTDTIVEDSFASYPELKLPLSKEELEPIIIDSNFYTIYKENPKYAYINEGSERNIISEFWDQIVGFISNFFRISNKAGVGKLLKYLFLILGIYLFVNALLKGTGISFFKKKDADIQVVMKGLPQVKDGTDLENQLRKSIDLKDFKKAIQLIYIKTLLYLNTEERIKILAAKTNLDYISEMKTDPAIESFKKLTSEFEFIHYGDFEATEEKYRTVDQLFHSINKKEM